MVKPRAYVPECGDVVWITLNPQAGREEAGRRPAVVVSPQSYNGKVGLAIFCPVTSQIKGYPFEVLIPAGLPVTGAILSDQVKSLDWRARKAELICALPARTISEVLQKLAILLTPDSSLLSTAYHLLPQETRRDGGMAIARGKRKS
jgi:mRNA interferase MazF